MRFAAPNSIEEAVGLLAAEPGPSRVLGGGTDLVVQLHAGRAAPALLVDVKRIASLRAITAEAGGFRIGAAVPCAELGEHAGVTRLWPGVVEAAHPFTVTSQFTVTGILAIISFGTVLVVGLWKHGFKFFSLFVPHGTPLPLLPLIIPIEFISFMVRPFSLALRLFVAMIAGHILVDVFGYFIVNGINAGTPMGYGISAISFVFIAGVNALELLVCCIQAYVFALLTSLYINDAVHLH